MYCRVLEMFWFGLALVRLWPKFMIESDDLVLRAVLSLFKLDNELLGFT